jgi:multiple sugar transport system permease protein
MGGAGLFSGIRRLPSAILARLRPRARSRPIPGHRARATGRLLFFAPALLLTVFLVVYPALQTVFLGFFSGEAGRQCDLFSGEAARQCEFVGFDNYADVLTDSETINPENLPWPPPLGTLLHNAIWIAIHLPISLFAGLWLALILRDVKGASIVKSFVFLGMVTPMVVGGVILLFLLEQGVGIVPSIFGLMGVESLDVNWTVRSELLLLGLIFGSVWLWTGFSLIVYSAGLTTIPKDYFEAARVDGASPSRIFFRIAFPLLKPITLVVVVMTLLYELKIFDVVFAAVGSRGGGGADVLALQMYRYGFIVFDAGRAAVVASLLTLMTLLATLLVLRRMVK